MRAPGRGRRDLVVDDVLSAQALGSRCHLEGRAAWRKRRPSQQPAAQQPGAAGLRRRRRARRRAAMSRVLALGEAGRAAHAGPDGRALPRGRRRRGAPAEVRRRRGAPLRARGRLHQHLLLACRAGLMIPLVLVEEVQQIEPLVEADVAIAEDAGGRVRRHLALAGWLHTQRRAPGARRLRVFRLGSRAR